MGVLISYSGTKVEQVLLSSAKTLTLRPHSTKEVSNEELEVVKAWFGKVKFKRFVQVHEGAPKEPRSKRPKVKAAPRKPTEPEKTTEPEKPTEPKKKPKSPAHKPLEAKPGKGSG